MEFDLLVRKYLRGTLSPLELERLRDMLEHVPEYRAELRQILELRSIIHDDALRLVPPTDLSDATRETVGARFAGIESLLQRDASFLSTPGDLADSTMSAVGQLFAAASTSSAPEADDDAEPRRRAVVLPYRIMGRALLAASLAVVALAPTMLNETRDDAGSGPARQLVAARAMPAPATAPPVVTEAVDAALPGDPTPVEPAATALAATATVATAAAATATAAPVARTLARTAGPRVEAVPVDAGADAASLGSSDAALASGGPGSAADSTGLLNDDARAIAMIDPDNPLSSMLPLMRGQVIGSMTYQPSHGGIERREDPIAAIPQVEGIVVTGLPDDPSRLLSVGVTLGSGGVMDADAPDALMQNSYYFSFSLSGSDRIGVEMGGSTFLQETLVLDKQKSSNIFAKQGVLDSSGSTSTAALPPGEEFPATIAQRVKQDITYGGVFYDRRLELDKAWDVCGRATFGAADGAVVTGVRVYTAYSPTKNVTFTLGIGGSKLFSLSGSTDDGSTNYGLYYGLETGF